ncbi:MAG: penicillin-binding protein activator [Nanoarchaeota archaeon]
MKIRTKIKLFYAVVFFIIGFIVSSYSPDITGYSVLEYLPGSDYAPETVITTDGGVEMKKEDVFKIGVILPLTGSVAVLGKPVSEAIKLAVNRANNAGEKIEVVFEDTKCIPKDAAVAVQKLINVDKVVAIIGEMCSSATIAAVPITSEAGVILISPASANPTLSKAGDFFFRTIPSDSLQAAAMAFIAKNKLGIDEAAVLFVNNDYGISLADIFEYEYKAIGGDISIKEPFDQSTTDFRKQLINIKNEHPEGLYFISSPSEAGQIMKQAVELGLKIKFLSTESAHDESVLSIAQDAADGLVITVPDKNDDIYFTRFRNGFFEAAGYEPGIFTAEAYDAANLIINGIRGSDGSRQGVHNVISSIVGYHGAAGVITFDEFGDVSKSYTPLIVKNGMFVDF